MQSRPDHQMSSVQGQAVSAPERELGLLRDVLRLLPLGVTVQDEEGRFLLINDAAAAQLGLDAEQQNDRAARQLRERQEAGLELLRAGRSVVAEANVAGKDGEQVLLTAHRPVH